MMIEDEKFEQYIFSDGKIVSMTCNFSDNLIELRLQVRKKIGKQIFPCFVRLQFVGVVELDLLESFDAAGNYSDVVLVKVSENHFYASFDPFGNSGEPNENDNFVINSTSCTIDELL
jgi:hypothetical protein